MWPQSQTLATLYHISGTFSSTRKTGTELLLFRSHGARALGYLSTRPDGEEDVSELSNVGWGDWRRSDCPEYGCVQCRAQATETDRSGSNTTAVLYCCVISAKLMNVSEPRSSCQLNDDNERSQTNKTVGMK